MLTWEGLLVDSLSASSNYAHTQRPHNSLQAEQSKGEWQNHMHKARTHTCTQVRTHTDST